MEYKILITGCGNCPSYDAESGLCRKIQEKFG